VTGEDGVLRVAFGEGGESVPTISQLDIRAVQLAKAAVRVGIAYVLNAAGVHASELESIYVAGAFGGALRAEDLVLLGVIPDGASKVVNYVGNASLEGSLAMAIDPAVADDAVAHTRGAIHVELATGSGFTSALMDAVALEPFEV
jgi:uncharacterized 2Fe-2S/4Fe-4S cluster protein (DUF4445 family)